MAFQDTSVSMLGSGEASVIELSQKTYSVSMSGSGGMDVSAIIDVFPGTLDFSGSLGATVGISGYQNTYVSMFGFAYASIAKTRIFCPDLRINLILQSITRTCSKEKSVTLKRYKNNTYPVSATLSRNGDYDITGNTFRLSTQIGTGSVVTVNGVITDALNGIVEFTLDAASVSESGTGIYEIEGNDGTHPYTYEKGEFIVMDTITPVAV